MVQLPASPKDEIAPRVTVLDFFKRNFMYSEKSTSTIKKVIPCFYIERYKKGEVILKQGDIGSTVLIVASGVVEMTLDDGKSVTVTQRLGTHEMFGEYAFVRSDHVLSQSVLAKDKTVCLVMDRDTFFQHQHQNFMEPIKARIDYTRKLLIRQSLKKLPFLNGVNEAQLADIDQYFRVENIGKGHTIFHQGDLGDKFYVLVSGKVVVTTEDDLGFIIEVVRLTPVSSFGEQALITADERNATITTLQDCQLYTLRKKEFQQFLRKTPAAREQLANSVEANKVGNYFADSVPIFKSMSKRHQHLLGVVSKMLTVDAGVTIKEEGSTEAKNLYLIVSGTCEVYVGKEKVKQLKPGDYFGEVALVSNEPSTATVKASEGQEAGVTLMLVSKEDFHTIFSGEQAFLSELKIRVDGKNCSLEDILNHPKGRASFFKHCDKEFAKENVDFYQDVVSLENLKLRRIRKSVLLAMRVDIGEVKHHKQELLEKRVKAIYDKYLMRGAPQEVNLPGDVIAPLLKRLDDNDYSYDMFKEARKSIYEMIEADNFVRYKASPAFQELISLVGIYKRSSVLSLQDEGRLDMNI